MNFLTNPIKSKDWEETTLRAPARSGSQNRGDLPSFSVPKTRWFVTISDDNIQPEVKDIPHISHSHHNSLGDKLLVFAPVLFLIIFLSNRIWLLARYFFSSTQSLSHVWLFATPWTTAHQASLSISSAQILFKLMFVEPVMPSNHLILYCPFLLPPSIFPSIRVFSNESVLRIRWPKYWNYSFSINPSNKYSGLISFSMDWLDALAVQGILKSLLQHHSSKA